MNKFNALTLVLVLMTFSLVINANTLQNDFYQNKPADMGDKQWSSLRSAVQEAKLLPSAGGGVNHNFGNSVSVDGDRMVVGAPNFSLNTIVHGAVYVFDFDGTTWSESQILIPFDGINDDQFGTSVSLSGTRLLVGARNDDDVSFNAGVVFVYDFDGVSWVLTQKLTADDAGSGYNFGTSLSFSGNRALIGSDKSKDNFNNITGAAYVFDFDGNNWNQTQKLIATDASASDFFGVSVSLSGNRALIGAFADDDNATNSGSAYIFEFDGNNWSQTKKLIAPNGEVFDQFGVSVSLSGTRALIGSEGDDESNSNSGAAYIFDFDGNNWNQTQKITASDADASDHFGVSVSLSGNRALIGAYFDDDNGDNSGSAYIFDFNGNNWIQAQKITASDTGIGDSFGFSVSLSENRALIGAHFDDSNGNNSGSVYVFDKNGSNWTQSQKLIAEGGTFATRQFFGNSVSLSNNRALIGAYFDDENGTESGAAYIFDFDGDNWIQTTKITALDGVAFDQFGISVSLSGDRALIGASNVDNNTGAAYIFDFNGNHWIQSKKLAGELVGQNSYFGYSVSLSENLALIGAVRQFVNINDIGHNTSGEIGSAYIFNYDGQNWLQSQELVADIPQVDDYFGVSVSLFENRLIVGSLGYDHKIYDDLGSLVETISNAGAVYIFDFDGINWSQSQKLTVNEPETNDYMGFSVSLSNKHILTGAPSRTVPGESNSGAAYIFEYDKSDWNQTNSFIGNNHEFLGFSVSITENMALISVAGEDIDGLINVGSVLLFEFIDGIWVLNKRITTSDIPQQYNAFGSSVDISSNNILIGAIGNNERGLRAGKAYSFKDIEKVIFENGFEN